MIIKVCGMRDERNIREVARLGVQWLGFIFYPRSPRYVEPDELARLDLEAIHAKRVGVFVNTSPDRVMATARTCRLDYLQLHGEESPDDCYALQKRGYSLIKAFPVAMREDLERTQAYEGRVDYFLFDTRCAEYGGSGRPFDWSVLAEYKGETPFLLSGGIRPGHEEAIRSLRHPRLTGIDLNSGFEREPGLKDIDKLSAFIRAI